MSGSTNFSISKELLISTFDTCSQHTGAYLTFQASVIWENRFFLIRTFGGFCLDLKAITIQESIQVIFSDASVTDDSRKVNLFEKFKTS